MRRFFSGFSSSSLFPPETTFSNCHSIWIHLHEIHYPILLPTKELENHLWLSISCIYYIFSHRSRASQANCVKTHTQFNHAFYTRRCWRPSLSTVLLLCLISLMSVEDGHVRKSTQYQGKRNLLKKKAIRPR